MFDRNRTRDGKTEVYICFLFTFDIKLILIECLKIVIVTPKQTTQK